MKKFKFILPLLAFVMAIGMSFAFVGTAGEDSYATKYILTDTGWEEIDVDCLPAGQQCVVRFQQDPSSRTYQVYDSEDENDPTEGNGQIINLPGQVPGSSN